MKVATRPKHEDEEDETLQQVCVNQQSPIVTLATKSDPNIGTTKIYWSKGSNPEDDKNVVTSPPGGIKTQEARL